jgi:hypothetical protein
MEDQEAKGICSEVESGVIMFEERAAGRVGALSRARQAPHWILTSANNNKNKKRDVREHSD